MGLDGGRSPLPVAQASSAGRPEAGVDKPHVHLSRGQQPPVDLVGAKLRRRLLTYSSAGANGSRSRTGAHQRRIANPSWVSNMVRPCSVPLGQLRLETRPIEIPRDRAMDVIVNQPQRWCFQRLCSPTSPPRDVPANSASYRAIRSRGAVPSRSTSAAITVSTRQPPASARRTATVTPRSWSRSRRRARPAATDRDQ